MKKLVKQKLALSGEVVKVLREFRVPELAGVAGGDRRDRPTVDGCTSNITSDA